MKKLKKIDVRGLEVMVVFQKNDQDFISLTDMARMKNVAEPNVVVANWMRTRYAIDFLGIWETIYNPNFNPIEFEGFKKDSGENSFTLSPTRWIKSTNAIGVTTKAGRYGGGTYAHKDIAFEFATWLSPEFKLYLIKEFQRLKEEESVRLSLGWDTKRTLTKINYRIHTDAIKANLIPSKVSKIEANNIYASEADVLNKALFGMTAKEWRDQNLKKDGNLRDYADVTQLVCLANLETLNAEFIHQKISQSERLIKLNEIAIYQMKSLLRNVNIKKLGS